MIFKKFLFILFCTFFSLTELLAKKIIYNDQDNEINICLSGKIDTVTISDINVDLLNKVVKTDKTFATKTTFDTNIDINSPIVKARISPRNKAVWGSDKQNVVQYTEIKDVNAVSLGHNHRIPARIVWIREGWLSINYANLFNMNLDTQTFTIGAFPFSVGRGISLGDAYSVFPVSLGFYSDNTVDQYAFGAKFSGNFLHDFLKYDFYGAILENKCTSVSETAAQTQAQAYGKKSNPARGFGVINWLGAARCQVTPLKTKNALIVVEPYVVYNSAPEQVIEFLADASSKLTTIGVAFDLKASNLEFGWEAAFNSGSQKVKGWDRNKIEKINRGGYGVYVYNHVYDVDPNVVTVTDANKVLYDPANSSRNSAINNVLRSSASNGTLIDGTLLYNGLARFRDPYSNVYRGYMAVVDAAYKITPSVKIAVTGGVASGDRNPNANLLDPNNSKIDGTYDGFIPLQEVYSGKQVKSAFVMGAGKLKRPLFIPETGDQFAEVVNGFSNLRFVGFGSEYKEKFDLYGIKFQPNLLVYWQEDATNKFDLATGKSSHELAHKFLGTEGNIFIMLDLSNEIAIKASGAIFKPGKHYYDIKGKPVNAVQRKILNSYNSTSVPQNVPVLGVDNAYSFTFGMSYSF